MRSPAKKIESYFSRRERASLVLPDGWYGRPFDSLFSLTSAQDIEGGLWIEIEGGRQMTFRGPVNITRTRYAKYPALKIDGFQQLSWRPNTGISVGRDYDSSRPLYFVS